MVLFASFMNTCGILIQKVAHSYVGCRSVLMLVSGLVMMALGGILDVVAFGFAAQSLLAPLGGSTIVFNALMSPCFTGEKLLRTDLYATAIILLGCTLTVAFGDHSDQKFTVDELVSYYSRIDVVLYFLFVAVCAVGILYWLWRMEKPYREYLETFVEEPGDATVPKGDQVMEASSHVAPDAARCTVLALNIKKGIRGTQVRKCVQQLLMSHMSGMRREDAVNAIEDICFTLVGSDISQCIITFKEQGQADCLLECHAELQGLFGKDSTLSKAQAVKKEKNPAAAKKGSNGSANEKRNADDKHDVAHANLPDSNNLAGPRGNNMSKVAESLELEINPTRTDKLHVDTGNGVDAEGEGEQGGDTKRPLIDFIGEDKKLLHAFLYSALSGSVGAQSILFGKTAAEMIKHPGDAVGNFAFYLIICAMGFTLFLQLRYLNMGLAHHDALVIVPIYQTFWVMVSIIAGGVYFKEFMSFSAITGLLFGGGVAIALSGIYMLTYYRGLPQEEEDQQLAEGEVGDSNFEPVSPVTPHDSPASTPRDLEHEAAAGVAFVLSPPKIREDVDPDHIQLEDRTSPSELHGSFHSPNVDNTPLMASIALLESRLAEEEARADKAEEATKVNEKLIDDLREEVAEAHMKSEADALIIDFLLKKCGELPEDDKVAAPAGLIPNGVEEPNHPIPLSTTPGLIRIPNKG